MNSSRVRTLQKFGLINSEAGSLYDGIDYCADRLIRKKDPRKCTFTSHSEKETWQEFLKLRKERIKRLG